MVKAIQDIVPGTEIVFIVWSSVSLPVYLGSAEFDGVNVGWYPRSVMTH